MYYWTWQSHTYTRHTIPTWKGLEVTSITMLGKVISLFLICIQHSNYQLFLNIFFPYYFSTVEILNKTQDRKSFNHPLALKSEQHWYVWLFKSLIIEGHGNLSLEWYYLVMRNISRALHWDQWQKNRYWSLRSYKGRLSRI